MKTRSSPLADQLAGLRAATTSNDDRGWLPASLHALIMAILARIFGRLEHILLLWQSGNLPAPLPRRTAHPIQHHSADADSARALPPPAPCAPCRRTRSAKSATAQDTHRAGQRQQTRHRQTRLANAMPAPNPAAIASSKPATATPPPQQARAPPPNAGQTAAKAPSRDRTRTRL